MNQELSKLKDIKPLVEIADHSLWIFLAMILGFFIAVALIWYLIKKPKRRKRRRLSPKELAIKALKELDFSDTKEAVYSFSTNIQKLLPKEKLDEHREFLRHIELYKYKKDVPSLSEADLKSIKELIKEAVNG
jgi:type VI protein secretion system component VasK